MHKQKSDKFTLTHANKIQLFLILFDIVAVNVAYFGALWLRFDCKYTTIEPQYIVAWTHFTPIYTVLVIIIFWLCSLYNSIWRFAGYKELSNGIIATALTGLVQCIGITVFFERMPITYYVFGIVLQFCFTMAIRFMYRFALLLRDFRNKSDGAQKRVMLIGAGAAGQMILRDTMSSTQSNGKVVC